MKMLRFSFAHCYGWKQHGGLNTESIRQCDPTRRTCDVMQCMSFLPHTLHTAVLAASFSPRSRWGTLQTDNHRSLRVYICVDTICFVLTSSAGHCGLRVCVCVACALWRYLTGVWQFDLWHYPRFPGVCTCNSRGHVLLSRLREVAMCAGIWITSAASPIKNKSQHKNEQHTTK